MKVHITGLGEIEADYAVIRQLRNMALHSAEDCLRMATEDERKGCNYSAKYYNSLFDMYMDMLESIKGVIG